MAIKEFLDPTMFSDPLSARDLLGNSIRRSLDFDVYQGKTLFQAIVLTRPIFLADVTLEERDTLYGTTTRDTGKLTKFAFKGRIIDAPSPHDYLPNPCNSSPTTESEQKALKRLVSLHTTFISSDDYTKTDNYLPEVGDIVMVELSRNVFSYDLQYGMFTSVKDNRVNVESDSRDALDCSSVKDLFAGGAATSRSAAARTGRVGTSTYRGTSSCRDIDGTQLQESVCAIHRQTPNTDSPAVNNLLQFIARGEGGYNSMNQGTDWCGRRVCGSTHDSRKKIGTLLTEMTVQQIIDVQARTDNATRLFAAGKYQIIPGTMTMAVAYAETNYGLNKSDIFNRDTQDKLGMALLFSNKQPNLGPYLRGENNNLHAAHIALATEWASVPHPDTGASMYPPNNVSSHTVEEVQAALVTARSEYMAENPSTSSEE